MASTAHVHIDLHNEKQEIEVHEHPTLNGVLMLTLKSGGVDICIGGPAARMRDLASKILVTIDATQLNLRPAERVEKIS